MREHEAEGVWVSQGRARVVVDAGEPVPPWDAPRGERARLEKGEEVVPDLHLRAFGLEE